MGRYLQGGPIYVLTQIGIVVPNATGSTTSTIIIPSKAARVLEYAFVVTTPGVGAANVTLNLRERGGATDRCTPLPAFSNTAVANTVVAPTGGDQASGNASSGGSSSFVGAGTFPESFEFDRIDLRTTLSAGTTSGPTGNLIVKFQE